VDMVINHSNSAGPVFASVGCVIGVADAITTANVEAIGDFNMPTITMLLMGSDGKPVLKDGKPQMTTLVYDSGLGILIPQRYVLELLDKAGGTRMQFQQ
jgi:S1-C subfamily serine protease